MISEKSVEFIMINDGSSDDTLALIQKFARRDNRVVVIDQANQGVCAARNNGLAVARGEYVFFLDGDDWLTDDASKVMHRFCKDSLPDIALFSNYKIREGDRVGEPWYSSTRHINEGYYSTNDYINNTSYFPISFKLYRREFLYEHGIVFDKQLVAGEVFTFFIHSLSESNSIGISPEHVMYYLKRRSDSATTTINIERDLTVLDTLHTINKYADNPCYKIKEKRAFLSSSFWLVTSFALIKYVGRIAYRKDLGKLIGKVRKDKEYHDLLKYFTMKGLSLTRHTMLAICIRFLPPRMAYGIIRLYYRFATSNNSE